MPDEVTTVMTARDGAEQKGAPGFPVKIVWMTPVRIVLVRAARVYLQTLVGLLGTIGTGITAGLGVTLTAGDFWHTLVACASIAVAPAVMSILLNTAELLAKLDESNPGLRA
jgi:hypothetical protein